MSRKCSGEAEYGRRLKEGGGRAASQSMSSEESIFDLEKNLPREFVGVDEPEHEVEDGCMEG